MRLLAASLLTILAAVWSAADEARIALPSAIAEIVAVGDHGGLVVTLEPNGDEATAIVRQRVTALPTPPRYPFAGASSCPDPAALVAPPLSGVPAGLSGVAASSSSSLDVVAEVVSWVGKNVTIDENDQGRQDAVSVLRRKRGRCSGRANLSVGILRVLGIPARVVHGLLAGNDAVRWHRWGEAWLGQAGWVAFDPGATVGLVRVRYLPTADVAEESTLAGARLTAVSERGFASLPRWRGMRLRPVGGATLRCGVGDDGPVTVTLQGPDGVPAEVSGTGTVEFSSLIPGSYVLRWRRGDDDGAVRLNVSAGNVLYVPLGRVEGGGR